MAVATGTAHGEAHPRCCGGGPAIGDILPLIPLGDGAALEVDHVIAVEASGNFVAGSGAGQEVAGELEYGEAIKRHVAVEGLDNPVAPGPHVSVGIDVIAVGIRVA